MHMYMYILRKNEPEWVFIAPAGDNNNPAPRGAGADFKLQDGCDTTGDEQHNPG